MENFRVVPGPDNSATVYQGETVVAVFFPDWGELAVSIFKMVNLSVETYQAEKE